MFSFPGGLEGKASACNAGDLGSIPGSGRSPGEGNGNPFQYSCHGQSHGWRSLIGYSPWCHEESDTTEQRHILAHGDKWFGNKSVGKRENKIFSLPLEIRWFQLQNQTGTTTQLKEDGIKVILSDVFLKDSGKHMPRLYAKVANIEQEEKEAPDKFLHSLLLLLS